MIKGRPRLKSCYLRPSHNVQLTSALWPRYEACQLTHQFLSKPSPSIRRSQATPWMQKTRHDGAAAEVQELRAMQFEEMIERLQKGSGQQLCACTDAPDSQWNQQRLKQLTFFVQHSFKPGWIIDVQYCPLFDFASYRKATPLTPFNGLWTLGHFPYRKTVEIFGLLPNFPCIR
ncbi:uncharacterized protein LOC121881532 [Thunnus maccoyii]|uniref:uncharacterized protein LOC121881532 n=1 Tax=Thunnus maccoyii TaxID=8240 RepID=UPI001C4B5E68|nr:uncharacterized protein LOC121881532 [Thunnus maccoyii]XP_042245306.1 uncharacterized protein LOC121881532 [Thunnus maccoyii]XP_042245308.1 uncharacterized protein LOC121881532 [Thunnus maccoyii]XP_042245309.1 uncharacterized protein LOC121881532 [Thunnus maccoyii]XP_042245310.1 uncharacterized protein LOC121881532 [Thunnus maccoyii]XP_042245311.1 uncharacterized protein LOC121881532 [Thunnus maccoyii]XP_042245312.1 uncharacterized protein LOC121881532 [Thunnus maccoyii]